MQTPIGLASLDRDLRYVLVNDSLAAINGIPAAVHAGRHVADLVPSIAASIEAIVARIIATGEPQLGQQLTGETAARPGEQRCWTANWYPLRNAAKEIVGFGLAVQDVTQIEEVRRASEKELAGEAAALGDLYELSGRLWRARSLSEGIDPMLDGVIHLLAADKGNVQLVNSERGVLVLVAHRGFGKPFLEAFAEVSVNDETACTRALRTGTTVVIEDIEADEGCAPFRSLARAAGYRGVTSAPLIAADGSPLGVLSTHFASPHQPSATQLHRLDLYARRAAAFIERCRLEDALQEAHAALEARVEARTRELQHRTNQLRRLASALTVAEQHAREGLAKTLHDGVQQLLIAARMQLESLTRGDGRERRGSAEILSIVTTHLDDALSATRALSIELSPPALRTVGLVAAFEELAAQMSGRYRLEVCLSLDAIAEPDSYDVRVLVFESVRELLFNVVKHATVREASLELAAQGDEQFRITVADRGSGLNVEAVTRHSSKSGGGLGLVAIRERLILLGGQFEIESTPGHGTRVTLVGPRLSAPVARGSLHDVARTPAPAPAVRAPRQNSAPVSGIRLLLVDDQAVVRDGLAAVLADYPDFTIVGVAADGLEAIEQARVLQPDVVVMDIRMPGLDGVAATRRIRQELPHIQVVGLSFAEGLLAGQMVAAGAAAHVVKGGELDVLLDHLRAAHRIAQHTGAT